MRLQLRQISTFTTARIKHTGRAYLDQLKLLAHTPGDFTP